MNNTKETIGPRGTVAGFRPLIGEERWHRDDFTTEMLEGGWRPMLNEELGSGEIDYPSGHWVEMDDRQERVEASNVCAKCRTKRPLPQPQVETFEAHGHVWYRHVPGDACPVERYAQVTVIYDTGSKSTNLEGHAFSWDWSQRRDELEIVGYRFPDFPAVHTPLQQEQPSVQPVIRGVGLYKAVEATDTTKQQLLRMYHGWCDFAPDDVAECMEDVRKLLYPTDAERCEAAFQKWKKQELGVSAVPEWTCKKAWQAAWNAAKQEKP